MRTISLSSSPLSPMMTSRLALVWRRRISSAIFLEHSNDRLNVSNQVAISAALRAGSKSCVGVLPTQNQSIINSAKQLFGLSKLIVIDHSAYEKLLPEVVAPLLFNIQQKENFTHWWTPHTSIGKNIFPRFVGILLANGITKVAPIADIIAVDGERLFKRPIYAGNAISSVESTADINIITVRTTSFSEDHQIKQEKNDIPVEVIKNSPSSETLELTKWVSEECHKSDRPDLSTAPVVVSGGRALKGSENFKLLYSIAELLGGAVGASRAAVDAGYVPNDLQVGQTGKIVAPKLYIAVGISGAIQHVAGMKDSRTIIAINKDADAPIFQIADYGMVGDLFKILPELKTKLAGN